MYARSTTFHAQPELIDAGIEYCQDEVLPALLRQSGCVGFSLLVDRAAGRCIATSSWQTHASMAAGAEAVTALRTRADEILGSDHAVQEWEVALMHRAHRSADGAVARVTWLACDPSETDRAVDVMKFGVVPQLDLIDGFCGMSLLVDRDAGRACVTATYADRQALQVSAARAAQLRAAVADESGGEVQEIAELELALAHFHVPERV